MRDGHPVSGLKAQDFVVFEEDKAPRITNVATAEALFEIALLLDTSGSTRDELGLIRQAANAFISALRPGDRVAIVAFRNAPGNGSPIAKVEVLSRLTDDRRALRQALGNTGTSNGTPYYDALNETANRTFTHSPRH